MQLSALASFASSDAETHTNGAILSKSIACQHDLDRSVGDLVKKYTSAAAAPDLQAHFDQVAQAAPASVIAEGFAAAFNSDKTPAFSQMLTTLFNNSSGDQKARMSNLLSSLPETVKTDSRQGAQDSPEWRWLGSTTWASGFA